MRQTGPLFILCLFLAGSIVVRADDRPPDEKIQITVVRLKEYKFEPSRIMLKVGENVELVLINEGTVLHEFVTEALQDLTVEVKVDGVVAKTFGLVEMEIPPKAKVTLRFTPEKAGEFQIACHANLPKDHFKEGMVGKLIIR